MRTRVGYAGGTKDAPTYRSLGDHTEAFQVDFDPARISFARLLEVFWGEHDPRERARSTQYRAVLFTSGPEQERVARESRDRLEAAIGAEVRTEVRPLDRFWPAEDYHQKYRLRADARLMESFRRLCPDEASFRESPAAAKVNAYLAGDLPVASLREQLAALGFEAVGEGRPDAVRALAPAASAAR